MSHLCTLNDANLPDPPIFGANMREEYYDENTGTYNIPDYVKKTGYSTSKRSLNSLAKRPILIPSIHVPFRRFYENAKDEVFSQADIQVAKTKRGRYNAYDKDIASVTFYFGSPTVFQFKRAESQTWEGFMSQARFYKFAYAKKYAHMFPPPNIRWVASPASAWASASPPSQR